MAAPSGLRVLELYSGIGGMHCALKESGVPHNVVSAMDVNTNANQVYSHNFPDTSVCDRAIEILMVKKFEEMKIDMILMSPPCQPFTRVGKKQDVDDIRTKSFLHVLDLLTRASSCPSYILLENVKGFEGSQARDRLITTLQQCGYAYQELLLTPLQFGIPNSRLRYFLIAKKTPLKFTFETTQQVLTCLPECPADWLQYKMQAFGDIDAGTQSYKSVTQSEAAIGSNKPVTQPETGLCREDETQSAELQSQSIDACSNSVKSANQSADCACSCGGYFETDSNDTQTDSCPTDSEPSSAKRLKLDISPNCDSNNQDSENNGIENQLQTDSVKDRVKLGEVDSLGECEDGHFDKKNATVNEGSVDSRNEKRIQESVIEKSASNVSNVHTCTRWDCLENHGHNMRQSAREGTELFGVCLKLDHFLTEHCNGGDSLLQTYGLPEKELKRFVIMDIVNPCSRKTTCFTKRYGHFMEGAGSIVQTTKHIEAVQRASHFKVKAVTEKSRSSWDSEDLDAIRGLGLRYFSPREIANLLCFPQSLSFPSSLSTRQQYMLLGNSLNVHVVAVLIKLLVQGDTHE